jgi:hypothetical protein
MEAKALGKKNMIETHKREKNSRAPLTLGLHDG